MDGTSHKQKLFLFLKDVSEQVIFHFKSGDGRHLRSYISRRTSGDHTRVVIKQQELMC